MKWCLSFGDLDGFHTSKSLSDSFIFCHVLKTASKFFHGLEDWTCSLVDVEESLLTMFVCGDY